MSSSGCVAGRAMAHRCPCPSPPPLCRLRDLVTRCAAATTSGPPRPPPATGPSQAHHRPTPPPPAASAAAAAPRAPPAPAAPRPTDALPGPPPAGSFQEPGPGPDHLQEAAEEGARPQLLAGAAGARARACTPAQATVAYSESCTLQYTTVQYMCMRVWPWPLCQRLLMQLHASARRGGGIHDSSRAAAASKALYVHECDHPACPSYAAPRCCPPAGQLHSQRAARAARLALRVCTRKPGGCRKVCICPRAHM